SSRNGQGVTRGRLIAIVSAIVLSTPLAVIGGRPGSSGAETAQLARTIPARAPNAMTGSAFAASIAGMDVSQRERAILREVLAGNLPAFLRQLVPVELVSDAAAEHT